VSAVLTTTALPKSVPLSVIVMRCKGRPSHHTIIYSGIVVSYWRSVNAVLTTTTLPTAVSLSVLYCSERLPNHHTTTERDIFVRYCSAVKAVLTTTPLPTALSLSVIVVRFEGRPNHQTISYSGLAVS